MARDAERAVSELVSEVASSGLLEPGQRVVALVSGGPDSACLAAGLAGFCDPGAVTGLHLNYGLREGSDGDERTCRTLCDRLGLELTVIRPDRGRGNLQDWARRERYQAAERLRAELGAEAIATGHTRTDVAETFLYRLAASPGSRALLGLAERRGRVVRPLIGISRRRTRELAGLAGLPFADDPSNLDPGFARARIRARVMPELAEINPSAEENLIATRRELSEQAEALEQIAAEVVEAGGERALRVESLAPLHPALRRLALRRLAERAAGRPVPLPIERERLAWRLLNRPEGGRLDLGGGLVLACEAGTARVLTETGPPPDPVELPLPGEATWGGWRLAAGMLEPPVEPRGPEVATLDASGLGDRLTVRSWRDGDRIGPLGLDGTKSLQDLFTDSGLPRSLRRKLPIFVRGEEVVWVPGVAVAGSHRIRAATERAVLLTATSSR